MTIDDQQTDNENELPLSTRIKKLQSACDFDVVDFYENNKGLVKKYLRKNTYKLKVDDFDPEDIPETWWYKNKEGILRHNIKDKPFTTYQKLEWIKCALDVVYFTRRHVKIISIDDGIIPFDLYDYQEELLHMYENNRHILGVQCRQSGKMIDIETPILTPTGFVKNKDLKIGDIIYGRDGKETNIIGISQQRNDMKQYRIVFDNGEEIKACGDHRWIINHNRWKNEKLVNTNEMFIDFQNKQKNKKNGNIYIDTTKPIEFDEKELLLDPYWVGLWLGDGDKSQSMITCHLDDYNDCYIKQFNDIGKHKLDLRTEKSGRFYSYDIIGKLRKLNLLNNKHIPEQYIFNSIDNRIALIQGLMDSDGNCDKEKGSCEFYQKSKEFCEQFKFLLSTLGIKSRLRVKKVNGELYHTVSFCVTYEEFKLFRLERKLNLQKKCLGHKKNKRHYIHKMELLKNDEKVWMQCLSVDNSDHMFLCSKSLIPTHNTQTTASFILHFSLFNDAKTAAIIANKADQAQEILERIQLSFEMIPLYLQNGVRVYNKRSMKFGNNSKIFTAASGSSAVRGKSISCVSEKTKIKIRNKETGIVEEISIQELEFRLIERNLKETSSFILFVE